MLLTGELSHHPTLAHNEKGRVVVAPFHSNTERGYLNQVLKPILEQEILMDWIESRAVYFFTDSGEEVTDTKEKILDQSGVIVEVSEEDRDPYQLMNLGYLKKWSENPAS
ncbi:MAG: hypothetical protein M1816_007078 [Peltula sp. TS41687]|nr:MAG: hypothetical protein M1816_007078 [Peltula sp. TS41687]